MLRVSVSSAFSMFVSATESKFLHVEGSSPLPGMTPIKQRAPLRMASLLSGFFKREIVWFLQKILYLQDAARGMGWNFPTDSCSTPHGDILGAPGPLPVNSGGGGGRPGCRGARGSTLFQSIGSTNSWGMSSISDQCPCCHWSFCGSYCPQA